MQLQSSNIKIETNKTSSLTLSARNYRHNDWVEQNFSSSV